MYIMLSQNDFRVNMEDKKLKVCAARIPIRLHKKLKIYCLEKGISIEHFLRQYVEEKMTTTEK